jgi:DNA-binding GntR family transcriptional regulator
MRASDRAYRQLRTEILEGDLPPGTVLAEVDQATRLGVSRTPLREALARLAADGLVTSGPGRGVVVTEVSGDTIVELFELRQALEEQAARLAARRRDPEVFRALQKEFREADRLLEDGDRHRRAYYDLVARLDVAIDEAVDNPYLAAALAGARTHTARIRRLSHDDLERLRDAAREHLTIVDAIVDGAEELAAHATHVHLYRSLSTILAAQRASAGTPPHERSA